MSTLTATEAVIYAAGWIVGTLLLAFLLKVGQLPSSKSTTAQRTVIALLVALVITAAVYGAKQLDKRTQYLRHRRHLSARKRIVAESEAKETGAEGASSSGAALPAGISPTAGAAPTKSRKPAKAGPTSRSLLETLRHGTRNAAALLKRAGAAPEEGGVDSDQGEMAASEGAQPAAGNAARIEIDMAPDDETMDSEHDEAQSMADADRPVVGGFRNDAFSARVRPRRQEAAARWIGDSDDARKVAELVTFGGMRSFQESTLYARDAYKTHQWHEPGEGMDQRYVDPSLMSYDPAFAAYSDKPILPQRRMLSTNAPAAF
jgi:hypothetical protein